MKDILIGFIKAHPWLIVLNISLMIFAPVYEILLPYMYGRMINDITTNRAFFTLWMLILVVLVAQGGFLLRDMLNERLIPTFESFVKTEIVDIILKKHNENFGTLTTGDIIYKISQIPDAFIYWFQWTNDYIIPYFFVFATAIIYFARFDWLIACVFIIFLALLFFISYLSPTTCLKYSRENDRSFTTLHQKIEEVFNNMSSIYSSNTKKQELEKLHTQSEIYSKNYAKTSKCMRGFKAIMLPLIACLIVIFILRSKFLITRGVLKSKFVPIFIVLTSMLSSIFWLIDIMRYSSFDLGSFINMNEMLQIKDKHRVIMPYIAPNGFGCRDLYFTYEGREIFKGLNIDFQEGKVNGFTGPVGIGKTTLLKLILGFHVPQQGDLFLNNTWYADLDIYDIRNCIGYIPQNPALFNETVLYNISYGNNVDRKDIENILDTLNIDHSFLDREAGKNGMSLSGGQRQLVWCLRVLFKNPPIILMDEPTASMDLETKNLVIDILKRLMKGKTIVIVTHDPYLFKHIENKIDL